MPITPLLAGRQFDAQTTRFMGIALAVLSGARALTNGRPTVL
jgi:hypothetical protein